MLLNFEDGQPFATGAALYRYVPIQGSDDTPRILIQIEVDSDLKEAILDTGGQFFLCTPEIANSIRPDPQYTIPSKPIKIKGVSLRGRLHRIDIMLMAGDDNGEHLTIEVTAFLPDADQEFTPDFMPHPYLGMFCCMERTRFALDPSQDEDGENYFYFAKGRDR